MRKFIKFVALFLCFAVFLGCSSEEEEKLAKLSAHAESTRAVMANRCTTDADCMVTGCRGTMCRAMPEPDYCDHRFVIALDDESDLSTVRQIIMEQLTEREADTVRVGGYAAGRWTVSFQATPGQRERVEQTIQSLNFSGFARLHSRAADYTRAAFEKRAPNDNDIILKTMKGAGVLLEKKIRSGDILSKDDIRNTWEQTADLRAVVLSEDDEIERIWAYDVIFENVSHLRLWPIDKRQRLSVRLWKSFQHRVDNGDIVISGEVSDNMIETFRNWTQSQHLMVLMLGQEIIASALPEQAIEDGKFELIIHDGVKNETTVNAVEMLQRVAQMKGSVRIDAKATEAVERDITCGKKHPRTCACIEGYCGWRMNSDYNACLFESF